MEDATQTGVAMELAADLEMSEEPDRVGDDRGYGWVVSLCKVLAAGIAALQASLKTGWLLPGLDVPGSARPLSHSAALA